MKYNDQTDSILRKFRKKSKRIVHKDMFTEFFYVNEDRQVIEFLKDKDMFIMEAFFKNFLPAELRSFPQLGFTMILRRKFVNGSMNLRML